MAISFGSAALLSAEELISFSKTQSGKVLITALGVGMINQVRPATSQIGFTITPVTSAKTELVNRNILA